MMELPPRTRRILDSLVSKMEPIGTTSAHAENTSHMTSIIGLWRNYLRARGEYCRGYGWYLESAELPPRTRRILENLLGFGIIHGTTSAHAENTAGRRFSSSNMRNYLRARGEYRLQP